MTKTIVTLGLTQGDLKGIEIKIDLESIHDMPDAFEFESKRLLSLVERKIGLTNDHRYWDSLRGITIRKDKSQNSNSVKSE